jgi:hypothetical protein
MRAQVWRGVAGAVSQKRDRVCLLRRWQLGRALAPTAANATSSTSSRRAPTPGSRAGSFELKALPASAWCRALRNVDVPAVAALTDIWSRIGELARSPSLPASGIPKQG